MMENMHRRTLEYLMNLTPLFFGASHFFVLCSEAQIL